MKKFFKKLGLFVLVFLVTMYFIGSCTERPEYKPKDENSTPVYTELTPDEYQRRMDEIVRQPPVTKTSLFKSPILQAHAESLTDKIDDFADKTGFYKFYDCWEIGWDCITDKVDGFFAGNDSYPVAPTEPKESVTIPFQYDIYGKNRVVYSNGSYEIIECRLITSQPKSSGKTGRIKYTRTNQYHQYTTFGFDIRASNFGKLFSQDYAFYIDYYAYSSGAFGSIGDFSFSDSHCAYFTGSSKNSLKQYNISSNNAVTNSNICYYSMTSFYPNMFTISSTNSNDYDFTQSVNNYYLNLKYWRFPNIYYNNNAGNTITKNNISNYTEYGYTYNSVTNSIEFDPDVYADFFDLNIKPQLQAEFDSIFSHFPDIDAQFGDLDIQYNNIIEIINEINQSTSTTTTTVVTGTYPIVTGGSGGGCNCDITVNATFPPEFYKKYPALTTEPAFVAENPDVDFAFNAPLPVRALKVSGSFITLASNFIEDVGLMPIALMFVSLGLILTFLL